MPRPSILALPLALALWPAASQAQEGPSFNCSYASTRTETAICSTPELARLEMRMFESYQGLVDRVGQSEARGVADDLLERRQACEGDAACIAERLLISMEVFEQRGRPRDYVVNLEPTLTLPQRDGQVAALVPIAPAPEPEPEPVPDLAAAAPITPAPAPAPAAAPDNGLPLAAQAPWPPESAPLPPAREEAQPVSAQEMDDLFDGAELASSDAADTGEASFDSPLSWAFMDLEREDRATIQERLIDTGFLTDGADGTWTRATQTALETFAAEEGSGSFDLTTETGASLLLDYIGSDAFASAFGAETAAAPPTVVNELSGTEW